MSFSVNIFELLEDENDSEKSTKKVAPKEKSSVTEKPAATQNKSAKPAKGQSEPKKTEQAKTQPQQASGARKTEKHQGSQSSPNERRSRPEKEADSKQEGDVSSDNRSRNRGKVTRDKPTDRSKGVPPAEGRNPAKRQFDRRSGTGRGKEIKKGGSGKGNWGTWDEKESPAEERRKEEPASENPPTENEGEATAADASEPKNAESKESKTVEKEPEKIEKSLDEYLMEVKSKEPHLPLPEPRAPGEGVDESQWKEFVPLERDQEEEVAPSKPKKSTKSEPKKDVVPASEVLNFREPRRTPRRDDRDRDQRRKGFGTRNNNNSNKRVSKSAPNFNADSFPSLTPATKA